jgi:hypothetical protein
MCALILGAGWLVAARARCEDGVVRHRGAGRVLNPYPRTSMTPLTASTGTQVRKLAQLRSHTARQPQRGPDPALTKHFRRAHPEALGLAAKDMPPSGSRPRNGERPPGRIWIL